MILLTHQYSSVREQGSVSSVMTFQDVAILFSKDGLKTPTSKDGLKTLKSQGLLCNVAWHSSSKEG